MGREDVQLFLETLKELNRRDYLIAKIISETGMRMKEVLSLNENQIHGKVITTQKELYRISETLSTELNGYVQYQGIKNDTIFKTSRNKPLTRFQIYRNFWGTCKKLGWSSVTSNDLYLPPLI